MGSDMDSELKKNNVGEGSKLAATGAYVLKLNVAGSGDIAWRKYDPEKKATLVGDKWRSTEGKPEEVATQEIISEKYGDKDSKDENVFVKYKKYKDVIQNTKIDDYNYRKETISVAGPLGWGGLRDNGSYSIQNNVDRCFKLVKDKVDAALELNKERPIHVLIKGHSRSGVAVSQIAIKLAYEFQNNDNVNIDVMQRDPVPGPFHFGVDSEIDYGKGFGENKDTKALQRLNSTVVYSLNTEYSVGFTPQSVLNAKRIVLVKWQHEVGLNKSKGFIFDNKRFHGSGLRNLQEGVYMQTNAASDDDAKLEKINASDCDDVESKIRSNGSWMQSARTEIILKAVKKKLGQEAIRRSVGPDEFGKKDDNKIFSGYSDIEYLKSDLWGSIKYLNTDDDNSLDAIMINANLNKLSSMILDFYKNHRKELEKIYKSEKLKYIRESKELKPLVQLLKNTYESKELKPLACELKNLVEKLLPQLENLLKLLEKYAGNQWVISYRGINWKKSFCNTLCDKIREEIEGIKELNKEGDAKREVSDKRRKNKGRKPGASKRRFKRGQREKKAL